MNLSRISSAVLLPILLLLGGCTLVPTPVRLLNKPHLVDSKAPKEMRVCVFVRDERPEMVQKIHMSGITRTSIFMIPTSFAFLAHSDRLESIVAHHAKKNLERQGYTVVRSSPVPPDELSEEPWDKENISDDDKDAAWDERRSQDDEELKGRKAKKKGSALEDLEEESVSAWGKEFKTDDCDGVVDIRIRKFWTDYGYFGSYSWMSTNISLCDPIDPQRRVVYGKKARGLGYMFSFFTPLTPGADIPVSMNTSYWFTINSFEKFIDSEAFKKEMTLLHAEMTERNLLKAERQVD